MAPACPRIVQLDPGGAAEDPRRLHVLRLECGSVWRYFLESEGGQAGRLPSLRRRDAPSLSGLLGAVFGVWWSSARSAAPRCGCPRCSASGSANQVVSHDERCAGRAAALQICAMSIRSADAHPGNRSAGRQALQQQYLDRLLATLHLHRVERLRLGALEQLGRLGADRDATGRREPLDLRAEVDRVGERAAGPPRARPEYAHGRVARAEPPPQRGHPGARAARAPVLLSAA